MANTGQRAGTETVQAYVTLPAATGEPGSRLVGWQKVTLQPGEHRWVEITLSRESLADEHLLQYWSSSTGAWTTATGSYGVTVGGSSDGALSTSFTVRPAKG